MHSLRKTIELRLNDEKRRQVKIGDEIEFTNRDIENEKLTVTVEGLIHAKSFSELYDVLTEFGAYNTNLMRAGFAGDCTKQEFIQTMREYYTEDTETNHGVVAIEIRAL